MFISEKKFNEAITVAKLEVLIEMHLKIGKLEKRIAELESSARGTKASKEIKKADEHPNCRCTVFLKPRM